jgi:hypothetical protein
MAQSNVPTCTDWVFQRKQPLKKLGEQYWAWMIAGRKRMANKVERVFMGLVLTLLHE